MELDADALPVSPLQEGFFFHAEFDHQAADLYFVQELLDLGGPVDPDRLRHALQLLLDRHPLLRAGFRQLPGGEVVQRLADHATLPWREADTVATGLADILRADRAERFALDRPPLLRATLIRDGQHHRLLLTLHHIVADGWSVAVLLRELTDAYRGAELPEPVAPEPYLSWLMRPRPRRRTRGVAPGAHAASRAPPGSPRSPPRQTRPKPLPAPSTSTRVCRTTSPTR